MIEGTSGLDIIREVHFFIQLVITHAFNKHMLNIWQIKLESNWRTNTWDFFLLRSYAVVDLQEFIKMHVTERAGEKYLWILRYEIRDYKEY
jgi:hypothetical protein